MRRALSAWLLAASACGGDDSEPRPAAQSSATYAPAPNGHARAERTVASAAETYRVTWTSAPDPIPLGEPFEIAITVERADGIALARDAAVEIDAGMPQHQHGMNRRPTTEALPAPEGSEGGRFRCRDMLFHMPGQWTVTVDVTEGPILERTQWTVELE